MLLAYNSLRSRNIDYNDINEDFGDFEGVRNRRNKINNKDVINFGIIDEFNSIERHNDNDNGNKVIINRNDNDSMVKIFLIISFMLLLTMEMMTEILGFIIIVIILFQCINNNIRNNFT